MKTIGLRTLVEELNLKNLTPDVDMDDVRIATPDINRPALQLTGYYEHFANERVQGADHRLCGIFLSAAP